MDDDDDEMTEEEYRDYRRRQLEEEEFEDDYELRFLAWNSHWYNRNIVGYWLQLKMMVSEWWHRRHPTDFPF